MKRPDKFFHNRIHRPILLLACVLLGSIALIPRVHAATPLFYVSTATQTASCNPCTTPGLTGVQSGDLLIVQDNLDGCESNLVPNLTSSPSETWAETQVIGDYIIFTAIAHSTGTYTASCALAEPNSFGPFSISNFRGTFNGFGSAILNSPGASQSGSDTATLNVQSGSLVYEGVLLFNNNQAPSNCPTASQNSGQTQRMNNCVSGTNAITGATYTTGPIVGAGSIPLTISWAGCTGGSSTTCQTIRHSVLELTSVAPSGSGVGITSACYGNCGSPPITLINTNATHTTAFNQSLTLFYEAQAQANGFVANVTVNVAKTYINGQQVSLGIYTVQPCPPNQFPFTAACPAQLQASLTSSQNPTKGRFAFSTFQIPVTVGQWFGIAVSATLSGLDLNNTNTACSAAGSGFCANPPGLVQTAGNMPSTISSTVTLPATLSNVGLWAFVTSAIANGIPAPSQGPCGNNFAQIDCFLPALINDFCNQVTVACQTQSALLWTMILALIFFIIAIAAFSSFVPFAHISFADGMGLFTLLILIVVFMMTSAGLLPVWVDIAVFMVLAIEFGDKLKGRLG